MTHTKHFDRNFILKMADERVERKLQQKVSGNLRRSAKTREFFSQTSS